MNYSIQTIPNGSVTIPHGFRATGIAAGIKKSGASDLGILVSQTRCEAAGVFTTNQLKGASLLIAKEHLADGHAQAILVNSGCANACTGEKGFQDARDLSGYLGERLRISGEDVLPSSTGVIGVFLPLSQIREAIDRSIPHLNEKGGDDFARAIMTTDTVPKQTARKVTVEGRAFSIGGTCKGAGMIQPNMATMLCFITTDASISHDHLQKFLAVAVNRSFNRFTIDGDTSCCDTVILMANGFADKTKIHFGESPVAAAFQEALNDLCMDLTYQLARDGEGVEKVATIHVQGARCPEDALRIARSIANSPLVKTAMNGCDPNWGRILTAAGYSGVIFDPNQVDLWIGEIPMMRRGEPADFDEAHAHEFMQNPQYDITIDLHQGSASDFCITTDFSKQYIDINADYRHRT